VTSLQKKINRGVEFLRQGKPERAAELYRDILAKNPKQFDALHLGSVALFQLGQKEDAVSLARQALKLKPRMADCLSNLGRYHLSLGRLAEAVDSLERALRESPGHAMARFNLAAALLAQGKRREALAEAEKYIELAPAEPGGYQLAGSILADLRRPEEARRHFEKALELDPGQAEAENNLGNALQAMGEPSAAVRHYEEALRRKPDYAEAASNLGAAMMALGCKEEARRWFEKALEMQPGLTAARGNIANLLASERKHEEAAAVFREILKDAPGSGETWNNLGNSLQELGRFDEALEAYHQALRVNPDYYLVYNNIGNTLRRQGRTAEALEQYALGLKADPRFVEAWNNAGVALQDVGRFEEAAEHFERALSLRSNYADPLINLGNLWRDRGRPQKAIGLYRRALECAPDNAFVWNNLGCALGDQGEVTEAIDCYRKALRLMPDNFQAHSNILLNLHYLEAPTPDQLFAAHREFAARHEKSRRRWRRPHGNDRNPARKLRVGYVSADFRRHSVAFFIAPVIERHDRESFEVFLYSDVARPDEWTGRFAEQAGAGWRDIRGYNDERFAELVRRDRIDILVDLGGHTANSRLLSMASRPAPVQVSWLGYPNTTGLEAIGYRITDEQADPPGATDHWHAEKLLRLEGGFLCYSPDPGAPPVAPLPCLQGEPFTFGSFNNMAKVSEECVRMWAEILRQAPGSRLALKNKALSEPEARAKVNQRFRAAGIGEERILMSGLIDRLADHLEAYRLVDLGLDTWPYHGTTTTCEALWMGVPVVSRIGEIHVRRVGLSLLHGLGLGEFAAHDAEGYVRLAVKWAGERSRLAGIRSGLRERMRASPLTDQDGFTRNLEGAFRRVWRRWCEEAPAGAAVAEVRR
jgi:predicted O-linked N-acetylglucosamine transferase (SPINDLY family)